MPDLVFWLVWVVVIGEVWFKDDLSETTPWVKANVRKNAHKTEMYKRVTSVDGNGYTEVTIIPSNKGPWHANYKSLLLSAKLFVGTVSACAIKYMLVLWV